MKDAEPALVGGKTIEEWDRLWTPIPAGLKLYQPSLRHKAGLYRMSLNGQVVAIGTGTDKSGGLAKRLSDFHRPGDSGRNHHAGRLIFANRDRLLTEVLIAGSGAEAQEIGQQLKAPMIRLHVPSWTVPDAPYMRKG